jgi:hypothetical protein
VYSTQPFSEGTPLAQAVYQLAYWHPDALDIVFHYHRRFHTDINYFDWIRGRFIIIVLDELILVFDGLGAGFMIVMSW